MAHASRADGGLVISKETGQFTIEAILLMAAMISISLYIGQELRNRRMAAILVEGPWQPVRGMIENGVWVDPKTGKTLHPSHKSRHASGEGEDPPNG